MRAVSIPVSDISAVSGFVLPGDRVDILLTMNNMDRGMGQNQNERMSMANLSKTELIFENIRVLAIGQIANANNKQTVIGGTATLELTLQQAKDIETYREKGQINLILRSLVNDDIETGKHLYNANNKKEIKIYRGDLFPGSVVLE